MQEDNQVTALNNRDNRHTATILQGVNDIGVSTVSSPQSPLYSARFSGVFGGEDARTIPCDFSSQSRVSMERENSGFSDQ
jgi:hypothetical protein